MNNRDVAASFDEIADLLEFQNANPFRVRAYRNAARRITDLPEPLANVAADPKRTLTDIDGIGKDLAQKIEELLETGKVGMLEELRSEIPAGVLDVKLRLRLRVEAFDQLFEARLARDQNEFVEHVTPVAGLRQPECAAGRERC